MRTFRTIKEYQEFFRTRREPSSIGFVPTMGSLHDGHLSLCKESLKNNQTTIVSIFVNPTQFNDKNDFNNYPVDIHQDINKLKNTGVEYLFLPESKEIYNDNFDFRVTENNFSLIMEGEHRPGHFTGVLTVVLKLLNIIKPHNVYMGQKDYQQAQLITNMVNAFFMDINIHTCSTIRDCDGLALSSRNKLLTETGLKKSKLFNKLLASTKTTNTITEELIKNGFQVEYIKDYNNRRFGAVKLENIRLIDNVEVKSN